MNALQEALDLWNAYAVRCGWPLVRRLTSDRERKLRVLLKQGMADWQEALAKAEASDFLCGRTERSEKHAGWRFSIDAMLRESFFVKILEGNYDNRDAAPIRPSEDPETLLWKARLSKYQPGGFWLGMWGPKPGEPGCQAPSRLVSEWQQRHMH